MLLIYVLILTKITEKFLRQLLCGGKKKKMSSLKDAVNVWKRFGEVQPDVLHTHLAQESPGRCSALREQRVGQRRDRRRGNVRGVTEPPEIPAALPMSHSEAPALLCCLPPALTVHRHAATLPGATLNLLNTSPIPKHPVARRGLSFPAQSRECCLQPQALPWAADTAAVNVSGGADKQKCCHRAVENGSGQLLAFRNVTKTCES